MKLTKKNSAGISAEKELTIFVSEYHWKWVNSSGWKRLFWSDSVSGTTFFFYTQRSFRNFIKSNQNQIVFTIFWLIWNQTDVHLVQIQSGMFEKVYMFVRNLNSFVTERSERDFFLNGVKIRYNFRRFDHKITLLYGFEKYIQAICSLGLRRGF